MPDSCVHWSGMLWTHWWHMCGCLAQW